MSSARDTAISTPELLERILLYLPIRDLLVSAPRICKMWQAIILTPTLQRALFFQPDPSLSERVQNPLLADIFHPFFASLERSSRWKWANAEAITAMPWSYAVAAFKRPEASWRRMLVAQPPVERIIVSERSDGDGGEFERRAILNDSSLRMGLLYDLVLPLINRVASSFRIYWNKDVVLAPGIYEISLAVIYTEQCCVGLPDVIDDQFHSDASETVELKFGDWSELD